jgi:hypothetical protein
MAAGSKHRTSNIEHRTPNAEMKRRFVARAVVRAFICDLFYRSKQRKQRDDLTEDNEGNEGFTTKENFLLTSLPSLPSVKKFCRLSPVQS